MLHKANKIRKRSQVKVATLTQSRQDGFFQNLSHFSAAIAVGFGLLLLTACNPEPEVTEPEVTGEVGADLEDVEEETSQLIGQNVTVSGEVEQVVGPRGFIIQEEQFFDNESVLVVSATDVPLSLIEGAEVQVNGTVRELAIAEVEQEYGFDLDPQLEVEIENRPVIVAEATELIEGE